MTHRYRQVGATVLAAGCALTIAACGSSSSSSSGTGTGAKPAASGGRSGAQPTALKLTTTQRACLKKHGVTLPAGGSGAGTRSAGGPGGTPPTSANGAKGRTPPKGAKAPTGTGGTRGPGAGGARGFAKQRAALKDCGISLGTTGHGGSPAGATATTGG